MFRYWWFLYGILFIIPLTLIFPPLFILNMPVLFILHILLFFLVCLAARPSREIKNYAYFKGYIRKFWFLLLIMAIAEVIGILHFGILYYPLIIFLLFSFDSDGMFDAISQSFLNTIKMFIYNLPIFLIIFLLLWSGSFLLLGILGIILAISPLLFIISAIAVAFTALLVPIEICIITNIYIKKLHEQSELYFTTQK
jgi:hypothetical protein